MAENYKISLGIDFNDGELKNIKKQLTNLTDNTHRVRIDIDNSRLLKQIEHAKKELKELNSVKGNQPSLTVNTQSLEKSLSRVADVIEEVRKSLGTLDDKSGMKSLLSSVNQIATALGKVENESDNLVKSLSALSKKDFSINFDLKMGKSASQISSEQGDIKRDAISQLKQQAKALEDYLDQYYKVAQRQEGVVKLTQGTNLFSTFWEMSPNIGNTKASLKQQVSTYKQYIDLMQEAAKIKGVDLSSVTSGFSKTTNDIVEQTKKVSDGVEEAKQALKGIFGGSLDVEGLSGQLQPIIADLGEIKTALQSLSSNNSIDGLTQSFNRLSETLEKLTANLTLAKNTLDTGFSNTAPANNAVKAAQQTGQKIGETIGKSATQSAKQSINIDDVIDEQVLDLMEAFSIAGDKGSNAFKEIRQALVECRNELNILKNSDIGIDEEVFDTSRAFDKVSDAIANQIRAVNSLGDEYVELAKYMKSFNDPKKGNKVRVPDFIKQEQGDDYKSTRGTLGIAFNTEKGISFASFIEDLNHELGIAIDLTNGEEKAYEELVHKLRLGREQLEAQKKSQTSLQANASTDDILTQNYINKNEIRDVAESAVDYINAAEAAEKALIQASNTSANTVVKNEERKQQAYQETAKEFLAVQKGSFQRAFSPADKEFGGINNTAKSVEEYFKSVNGVLADTVSVQERFDADKNLNGFTVSLKNANGAAEQLRYTLRTVGDGATFFEYTGGSVNDNGVLKQMNAISAKADTLQNKLDKLKSGYSDSNAAKPIKDTDHISALSKQYDKVEKAIIGVRNADESTFASMISNAEKETTALENMVREFRNAENVATSLRSKDIKTVGATYGSDLDVLISKMRKDGVYTSGFEKGAENLRSMLSDAVVNKDKSGLIDFLNGLDKLEAGYKRASAAKKEFNRSESVGIDASKLNQRIENLRRISPEIDKFETEVNGAKVTVKSLLNDLGNIKVQGDFTVVNKRFRAFEAAAEAAGIAVKETVTKVNSVNNIKIKISDTGFNGFEQEVKRVHTAVEELEGAYPDLEAALKRLDIAMNNVYSADQANDIKRLVAANEEYENSLKQAYSQLKLYKQAEERAYKDELLTQKKSALSSEMEIWLKDNTRATKDFGEEIRRLQASLNGLDDKGVKLVGQQFKAVTKQAQAMGKTGLTVFDKLKSKAKEYMAYLSAAELFMYAEQALRAMFETVKEIDTAMTGLYRVTDLTSAEYDNLFNNMISSAKEYGATLNDIINATTDWVRAGFDADTALGMANVTTMYQHISDLDYDTASENLITAYNGFKDELNGLFSGDEVAAVNYIADILNELDKQNCPLVV